MNYYKLFESDGSMVSDYLQMLVRDRRSLAAVVRSIRLIKGYETTTIQDLINWINGDDKDRAHEVWRRLTGLPNEADDPLPPEASRLRKLQALKDTRRLLKRIAHGRGAPLHVIIKQVDVLATLVAEQRHENMMKRAKSR